MSEAFSPDIPDSAFDGPAEAPAAPETPTPVVEETPETPTPVVEGDTPVVEGDAPAEPKIFDEGYVKELRQESAGYRTKLRELETVFEGVEGADLDTFKYLIQTYAADPSKGLAEMARITQAALGQETPPAEVPADDEVLTVSKYEEMQRQQRVDAEAREISRQAVDLGYKTGSPEFKYLLEVAKTVPDMDLAKAHEKIEAQYQARIDAFVAGKAKAAEQFPTPPSESTTPASGERQLKTWRDVEAAIDEMF